MSDSHYQIRQKKLLDELDRRGFDALLVNAGPSLAYLTGLHFHLSERPVVAIFRPDGLPAIVLPALEKSKIDDLPFEIHSHTYDENPAQWSRAFEHAVHETRLDHRRVGIEPHRFRVLELRFLEEAAPRAAYLDGDEVLAALRMRKDDGEIKRMRKAVHVAETALQQTLSCIEQGITERQLASELTAQLFRAGSEPELPFAPIVAFAEATANPHAVPTDRKLKEGDLILCDWGASVGGYFSDLTRMFSYGEPKRSLREITEVVSAANEAARTTAGPRVTAAEVDRAARAVIEDAGYGEAFIHRTGHGLGLDGHEPPYIRGGSDLLLEPGMTFTIEPGIYLHGRGGARIEDVVVVTDDGVECLSSLSRELVNVAEGETVS